MTGIKLHLFKLPALTLYVRVDTSLILVSILVLTTPMIYVSKLLVQRWRFQSHGMVLLKMLREQVIFVTYVKKNPKNRK